MLLVVMQISFLYLWATIDSLVIWLCVTDSLYSWPAGQFDRKLLDKVCADVYSQLDDLLT